MIKSQFIQPCDHRMSWKINFNYLKESIRDFEKGFKIGAILLTKDSIMPSTKVRVKIKNKIISIH